MLLFYYASRYAWLECLFGRSDDEKTGKMPYCGWGVGGGKGGEGEAEENQSALKSGQTFKAQGTLRQ